MFYFRQDSRAPIGRKWIRQAVLKTGNLVCRSPIAASKTVKKPEFKLTDIDPKLLELVENSDKQTLGAWAYDCTARVLHFYETSFPGDSRPAEALRTLQEWLRTGDFHMKVIRKAALDAHAAAREVGEDSPARSAARAAGQAVSSAHAGKHALAAASYCLQAVHRANTPEKAVESVAREREWQIHSLRQSRQSPAPGIRQ